MTARFRQRPFAMSSPTSSQNVVPVLDVSAPATAGAPFVAVVPAAGLGTRLRPLTTSGALPKEMLPVGRKLALERIVEEMIAAGAGRVVFVLSPAKEALVRQHFGSGENFVYVRQPEMRGLGDAVLRAAGAVTSVNAKVGAAAPQRFVVALGDAVFEEPAPGGLTRRLWDATARANADVGLVVRRVAHEHLSRYGVVRPAGGASADDVAAPFPISDIVEKPHPDQAPSPWAAAARYVLSPDVFAVLKSTPPAASGEVQLTDALRTMLAQGGVGVAAPLRAGEVRHDLGGLDGYFRAFAAFALQDPDHGPALAAWLREQVTLATNIGTNA